MPHPGPILSLALCLAAATPAAAQEIVTPSGLAVTIHDVVLEEETGIARLRFLAPGIGPGGAGFDAVEGDFPWLCETHGAPALERAGWPARQLVVLMMDRPVPFGATDPDAVQYFEAFRIEAGACILEFY